jgi:hypothetical protein
VDWCSRMGSHFTGWDRNTRRWANNWISDILFCTSGRQPLLEAFFTN